MKRLLIISSVALLALVFRTSALPQAARLTPSSIEESNRAAHTAQPASDAESLSHPGQQSPGIRADVPKVARPELKLDLDFEANRGQAPARYVYVAHGPTYALGLSSTEIALSLNRPREAAQAGLLPAVLNVSADKRPVAMDHAQLHLRFMGASQFSSLSGMDPRPGVSNYFIGNDPLKWQTHVPHFGRVKMDQIYPGIDLVFYGNPQQLEYDFQVAPGADPRTIHLNAADATSTALDRMGDLVLATSAGEVRLRHPNAYQVVDGAHQPVDSKYRLVSGNMVQFEIGTYDHSKPLIIDPVMTYGVAIGGSNGSQAEGLDIDAAGDAYVTGNSCSVDFPTAAGSQTHPDITTTFCEDAFVLKLDPTASMLIYSDFVGGSGASTGTHVAVDASGDAFVTGATSSTDFPLVANIGPAAPVPCPLVTSGYNCPTGFIFKLSPDGSSMIFSSLLGGSEASGGLQVKLNPVTGDVVVVGAMNSSDFQPQPNTLDTTYSGASCADNASIAETAATPCFNGFLLGLNSSTGALRYGTFLGVSNDNWTFGLAFDTAGNIYVAGSTRPPLSSSIGAATNTYPPAGATDAGEDIFVAQLKLAQTTLSLGYLTVIEGEGTDMVSGIALDASENLYLTGSTTSTHLPVTSGVFQSTNNAAGDATCLPDPIVNPFLPMSCGTAFVGKLNAAGALSFLTYLGGSAADWGEAIGSDSLGNLWISGITSSSDFPFTASGGTANYNDTPFLAEMSGDGTKLTFASAIASQFGQSADLKIDSANNVYVAGYANTAPSSPGTYPVDPEVQTPMFVQKWAAGPGPIMTVSATSLNFGPTIIGSTSAPQTVTIANTGQGPLQLGIQTVPAAPPLGYSPTFASANASATPFLVTGDCGDTLAANSSCTLTVSLQPFASPQNCTVADGCDPQAQSASIVIQNNTPTGTQTIALSGTSGVGPVVAISPRAVTFPPQIAGTSSTAQSVQISNQGDINLVIANATLGGPNAADFQLTDSCTSALPPGNFDANFCQLSVVFSPAASATGNRTATLNFVDNAADSPQSIPITGTVATAAAALNVSPSPVSFGYTLIGGPTYAAQSRAEITNVSTSTQVQVTGVTIGGTNAADFNLLPNGQNGQLVLDPGTQGAISFYFNPTSGPDGPRTATATLTTAPPIAGLAPIPLQGVAAIGSDPGINIFTNPSPMDFGSVQVGQTSQNGSNYLLISNFGISCSTSPCGGPLTISSIVSGLSDYSVVSAQGSPTYCTAFPITMPVESECGFYVIFAPAQAGARNTTLTINSNDPGGPAVVPVTGVGLALPLGDLSVTALNFGYAAIGVASPPLTVNLLNTASIPLAVSGVVPSANYEVASNTCSTSVAPGASCTIGVTFTPPTAGAFSGTLTVSDNDAFGGQQTVALNGIGAIGPSLMIVPSTVNFPNQANNTTGPPQAVTLTNFGDSAITFGPNAFVTTSADIYVATAQFVISSNTCGSNLAVHASCVVNLKFAPTAPVFPPLPEPEPGTLNLADNARFSPQRVYLVGTAVQGGSNQTTTGLTSSLNPAAAGQPITFTAVVAGTTTNTPIPTGSVTFLDGTTTLGTATLNSSAQATFTTSSLGAGSHSITAVYGSDANYAASTSASLTEVVNGPAQVGTTTTLIGSPNPATVGQSVTLTATVAEVGGSGVPTGTVTFYEGTTSLGTGTLSSGIAAYSASSLAAGTHSITAAYGGDSSNAASTSSAVTITITAIATDFSIALSPTSGTASQGSTATSTITITPAGGFNQSVSFACSGLPAKTSCSFSPISVTPSGTSGVTSTLTINTDVKTSVLHQPPLHGQKSGGVVALASLAGGSWLGFLLLGSRSRNRNWWCLHLGMISVLLVASAVMGCGGSSTTTPKGTSQITVTATSGSTSHTSTYSLTIQ
jgi:hypothetical protein